MSARSITRTHLAVLLVVLALCPAAWSQSATMGTVKGKVINQDGKPLAGAVLVFTHLSQGRTYEFKTDKNGEYFSMGVQSGEYDIVVKYQGQTMADRKRVRVAGGQAGNPNDFGFQNQFDFDLTVRKEQSEAAKHQQEENLQAKSGFERAVALNKAGNFQEALTELEALAAKDPRQWVVHYQMALSFQGLKRDDEALASFKKAVELNPSNAQLYGALGAFYIKLNRPEEARKQFDLAAELSPDDAATAFFNLGINFINNNDFKSALEPLKRAVELDPSRVDAYYWLGVVLYNSAEYKMEGNELKTVLLPGTREAFEQYLALAPSGKYANDAREALTAIEATVPASVRVRKK